MLQSDLTPLARLHPLTTPLQVSLLQSDLEMQLGTGLKREWARVSLDLSSTRELRYKKLSAPPLEATVAMRDATEVRVADNHAGGGIMSILTPSCTHEIRSKDGTLLHR